MMALNKTCYSWRVHLENAGDLRSTARHRCHKPRGHDGGHDCMRLFCFGSSVRRWAA